MCQRIITTAAKLVSSSIIGMTFLPIAFNVAQAENVLSRAIERVHPCSTIKFNKFGVTIGVDQFQAAEIETLKVDVDHDDAKVHLTGSLACRTSDSAVARGDASARFDAALQANLGTCAVAQNDVHIVSTGGTFGFAVEAGKGTIEKAVRDGIADQMKALCR